MNGEIPSQNEIFAEFTKRNVNNKAAKEEEYFAKKQEHEA